MLRTQRRYESDGRAPTFTGLHTSPFKLLNSLETPYVPHAASLPRPKHQGEHSLCAEVSTRETSDASATPVKLDPPCAWSAQPVLHITKMK
jgi:hypothetical protein